MAAEKARKMELGDIGHRIAVAERRHPESRQCRDMSAEFIGARSIEADGGLGHRPRSVEKAEDAMMKNIGKSREGIVPDIVNAVVDEFGQVERQRSLRPEQP